MNDQSVAAPLRPLLATLLLATAGAAPAEWPMLGHDAGRSGATVVEIRPPFERKWYRAFPDEGLMAGVQPVVAGGTVYIGTLRGVLHAIDSDTGKDRWTFRPGGPMLHACAAGDGKVFFGAADGKLYALRSTDGSVAWTVQTGSAIWNAPAIDAGRVYVGSRDGALYCINLDTGARVWAQLAGGPLLNSPAVDSRNGRVVVGSENMRAYAFDAVSGRPLWVSDALPGVSFRGYHPVIAPDGSVLLTSQPCAGGDAIQQSMLDMVKEVFGDFASWRHTKQDNDRLRAQNFKLMADPATYRKQMAYLRRRLSDEPAYQTFFVLDGATGRQKFVAPVVYAESMNGPGAPPLVTTDGKVIVKYSALLRSRYEHYSPFLNVGYLDTSTGDITPIMDPSRTYGWHDSLLLVHDEQSQLSAGGRVLFNTHQDNVNALALDTLQGYDRPMCTNVHEPPPGAAVGIWADWRAGRDLPLGWEWFARGTAVYGGGSAIDVPVAIAGDSFYYLPTHEISAGCVLLAYCMAPDGNAAEKAKPPLEPLSLEQWKKVVAAGQWDWDTLESPRLDPTLKGLPESPPGTRARPLTEAAKAAVAAITDADLDNNVLLKVPKVRDAPDQLPALRRELERAVEELVSKDWRPMLFPAGKAPAEAYRFFTDPSETLYTLSLAFPHVSPRHQQLIRDRVARLQDTETLDGKSHPPDVGEVRTLYNPAPERLMRVADGIAPRSDTARLYPLWLWAHTTDDWEPLRAAWPRLREGVRAEAGSAENDCGNARLAGLIAACRLAKRFDDPKTSNALLPALRSGLRDRLVYEFAHTRGGLIVPGRDNHRSVFGRWRNLTPDVARLLRLYAKDVHRGLMEVYVDYHRPAWWLAWNVETLWGNEVPMAFPTEAQEVFAARAMILDEPAEKLATYVDLPWCKGDEYYIQKLALTLASAAGTSW